MTTIDTDTAPCNDPPTRSTQRSIITDMRSPVHENVTEATIHGPSHLFHCY